MDQLIVDRKLDSLRRCIQRIREKCPADATTLATDIDLQDIIVLNLSRAIQLCVDLALHKVSRSTATPPETMGEAFTRLAETGVIDAPLASRLRNAVGFRNIAVHNYSIIDWHIVHAIATRHLSDFEAFARILAMR